MLDLKAQTGSPLGILKALYMLKNGICPSAHYIDVKMENGELLLYWFLFTVLN